MPGSAFYGLPNLDLGYASALRGIEPLRRDANTFYYKPERPLEPQASFSLECAQWRHGYDGAECFYGQVRFSERDQKLEGALECRIHAENLSDSVVVRVPVRIDVSRVSVLERAELLLQKLFG